MKKVLFIAFSILVIGAIAMTISAPRMGGSPFASEDNALADLSGWTEDALDRTWTYVSANAAGNTYVVSSTGDLTDIFRVTLRFRAKQGGGYEHFIIHYVEYVAMSDITKLTLFGGASGDLINAAITDVAFSPHRFPAGFPIGKEEWDVEVVDTSTRTQATPASGTWYNIGTTNSQITLSPGVWDVSYDVFAGADLNLLTTNVFVTLSTANNTQSNSRMTSAINVGISSASSLLIEDRLTANDEISLSSETTLYLNAKTGTSGVPNIYFGGATIPTIIRAVSGYY